VAEALAAAVVAALGVAEAAEWPWLAVGASAKDVECTDTSVVTTAEMARVRGNMQVLPWG
jgi:hypothetical protein